MKNAEKLAMPFKEVTGMVGGVPTGYKNHGGLTKREMFAMNIAGHMLQSLNEGAFRGEWGTPGFDELAKQSVEYADELLKALEKKNA